MTQRLLPGLHQPNPDVDRTDLEYRTKRGRVRSWRVWERQLAKRKPRETPEEREAAEEGGQEYWSTFRR